MNNTNPIYLLEISQELVKRAGNNTINTLVKTGKMSRAKAKSLVADRLLQGNASRASRAAKNKMAKSNFNTVADYIDTLIKK